MVCVAVVARARYGHPLRFYITPHCPQCPPVAALKLRLVPVTASRPSGEGNRRYAKWPSLESVAQPSALPGRWHALRAAVCAPLWLLWRCGIGQALRAVWLVSGLRPVMLCVPPPTLVLRRCAASALRAGLPVRPPRGLPQPARLGCWFATSLVADYARNTGLTGLTACKPAWPLAYFSGAMVVVIAMYLIAACARSTGASGLFCM